MHLVNYPVNMATALSTPVHFHFHGALLRLMVVCHGHDMRREFGGWCDGQPMPFHEALAALYREGIDTATRRFDLAGRRLWFWHRGTVAHVRDLSLSPVPAEELRDFEALRISPDMGPFGGMTVGNLFVEAGLSPTAFSEAVLGAFSAQGLVNRLVRAISAGNTC